MEKKLDYQSIKWDKELKKTSKILKQLGESPSIQRIKRYCRYFQDALAAKRDYHTFYSNLHLTYKILANEYYLLNNEDEQCIEYMYLSSMAGILANVFDTPESLRERNETDTVNLVEDFSSAVRQRYSLDQPFPKCIQNMDHIYVQLFQGNFEKVNELLQKVNRAYDPEKPDEFWLSKSESELVQSILKSDEKALQKALIKHIKEYRKQPIGYSTFIDIYSIAFIKLANKYGMNCDIDIIEIPKMFFDQDSCKMDKDKIKVPFFDEAIVELKKRGIEWD